MLKRFFVGFMVLAFPVATLGAQTLDAILQSARDADMKRKESVNNYTVFEDASGTKTTRYCEKSVVDGYPQFKCRVVAPGGRNSGAGMMSSMMAEGSMGITELSNVIYPIASVDSLRRLAVLEGVDTSGSSKAYRIVLDYSKVDPNVADTGRVLFLLDATNYTIQKFSVDGVMGVGAGQRTQMSMGVVFEQYRNAGGMLIPHRTTMTYGGSFLQEMQKMVDGIKVMMAQIPPDKQAEVEATMGPLMRMASGQPIVTQVDSVRVNTGPPTGTAPRSP